MRAILILATAALLAGCTTRFDIGGGEWAKPGVHGSQVSQDEMECARQAVDARVTPETALGGFADIVVVTLQDIQMSSVFDRCMGGKGYQPRS